MNWTAIAVGAVSGVVAVLISAGILKLLGRSTNSKGAGVLYAIILAVSLTAGREVVQPVINAYQVEENLLKVPVYSALKQHEPQVYKDILAAFEAGAAKQLPQEAIWSKTRPLISEVATRRLPHAPDEVQLRFAKHATDAVVELHSKGGSSCFSYLNPAPGEAPDFSKLLSPEIVQRELGLVSDIVVFAAGQTRQRITDEQAEAPLQKLFAALQDRYTVEDFTAMSNPQTPGLDKRRYCKFTADLFDAALGLPAPDNSVLIRYLLQG